MNPTDQPLPPAFSDLERIGLLARRLSHDLSNEMTCAVTSLALFKSMDETGVVSEDLLSLDGAVTRLGAIIKHFGHILRTQIATPIPTPVGCVVAEAAAAAARNPVWTVKNSVLNDDPRNSRLSSRFLRGAFEEVALEMSSPQSRFAGTIVMAIIEVADKGAYPFLINVEVPVLLVQVLFPAGKKFDASKSNLYDAETAGQIIALELVRQSGGRAMSAKEGLTLYWPLS